MEKLIIGVTGIALLVGLWRRFRASRKRKKRDAPFLLPSDIVIKPAALLSDTEASLYNLLRMAVQDRYLILSQVPLWTLVAVEGKGKERAYVLNRIALKQVDFALVHPGTRQVEQVVQIDDGHRRPHQVEWLHVIDSVLSAAGVKMVKVEAEKNYSIPELTNLLGLEEEASTG